MSVLVVHESMFGNTRAVAESVAEGLRSVLGPSAVRELPVLDAADAELSGVELVVLGGPTHAFGMSRPSTRAQAVTTAKDTSKQLQLEPGADGIGQREWLQSLPAGTRLALFDTRMRGAGAPGHATRSASRTARRRHLEIVERPRSFYVDRANRLRPGETDRAWCWGVELARHVPAHKPD